MGSFEQRKAFGIFSQMTVLDEAWTAFVTGAFQLRPRSDHLAVGVGSHNGRLGRVTTDPRGSKVREDIPERNTRRHQPCRELMRGNADSSSIFVDPS